MDNYTSYDAFVDFGFDFDSAKTGSNDSEDTSKSTKLVRKKFAVPPVKVACLEW